MVARLSYLSSEAIAHEVSESPSLIAKVYAKTAGYFGNSVLINIIETSALIPLRQAYIRSNAAYDCHDSLAERTRFEFLQKRQVRNTNKAHAYAQFITSAKRARNALGFWRVSEKRRISDRLHTYTAARHFYLSSLSQTDREIARIVKRHDRRQLEPITQLGYKIVAAQRIFMAIPEDEQLMNDQRFIDLQKEAITFYGTDLVNEKHIFIGSEQPDWPGNSSDSD